MSDTPATGAPARTPPRMLRVRRTLQLTPHMRRITLAGPALAGFPPHSDGAHIKLLLPRPGQAEPVLPTLGPDGPVWPPDDVRPIARTYTVGRHDAAAGELDIDFVLHGDNGPASSWALHAVPGTAVGVAGPGGPPRFLPQAGYYLLLGDPSAFAALAAVLRALPADARGDALIEVPDPGEIQPLRHPPGIAVRWLSRQGAPAGTSTLLLEQVRALDWPAGPVSVTLAGESTQTVLLREYLLKERGVPRRAMYAVPYWKDEHTEEAYHAERHRIMDAFELAEDAAAPTPNIEETTP
ncbi:siderophore-interacting protein [Janthinobacterium agaricidamnosum]|uniref:Siderophore-interacting family protein n=1 Tax=Janthinobacterium agaricidamnosum NBRC 102515 = DSM 9628 TaxID=1349767 RepID=W0V757_9BURK|nr:siderophore-interacting protein [Janthinobacterium agaricidamnosum]CDG83716.1 siderophore-interacting family protein [Janthinobacterium agaricidamnosum NBRC 102515 = DSM 9628]